jgi:hypothetical protein
MMVPSLMGLKLGPVEDPSSFYMAKVIIMFPFVYALIHWLGFLVIFRHKTPKFYMQRGKEIEAKRSLNVLFKRMSSK